MTRVLKLVKGSTTLNLLNATDGITLRAGGDNWQPQYPVVTVNGDPDPVVETMRLQCRGTSQNAIAGTMQIWADMMRGASIYRTDANGTAPVWLHAKLDDETNERRSIVHRIDAAWVDSGMTEAIDQDVLLFDAAIERGPYWEAITPTAMGTMVYTNLVANPAFAIAGAGGADVFASWVETAGDGAISGAGLARLTTGPTANTKIAQTVTVVPGHAHTLVIMPDLAPMGPFPSYLVYDVTHSADIISGDVGNIVDGPLPIVATFTTPAGCTSLRLDVLCSYIVGATVTIFEVDLYDTGLSSRSTYDYTANGGADVVGDVPARLAPLTIKQYDSSDPRAPVDIETLWVGVRSENAHPGLSSFAPVWECETGVAGVSTAGAVDTEASGYTGATGITTMRVTPGSADWQSRLTIKNAAGAPNFGDYLWLLRSRVSAGTYEVKMRWASSSEQYAEGPIVEVANTKYLWKEMGIAAIPLANRKAFDTGIFPNQTTPHEDYYVDIWARRTAGTGTFDMDCLGLVPYDEALMVLDDVNWPTTKNAGTATYVVAAESPRGDWQAASVDGTKTIYETPTLSGGMALPPGDGRLVIFVNGTAEAKLSPFFGFQSDSAAVLSSSQYYPRWLSLRGAE